jgi:hypothetical protein
MPDPTDPQPAVREALATFTPPRPMRRGSLSERNMRCHKSGCACANDPDARHGPYFCISRVVAGKTQSRWVPAEQAPIVREQIEAGQRFRRNVEAYWLACEQWADAQLEAPSKAAAKNGASKRRSTPRSKRS